MKKSRSLTTLMLAIITFIYSLVIALRSEYATPDTISYLNIFHEMAGNSYDNYRDIEPGFLYFFTLFALQPYIEIPFFIIPLLFIASCLYLVAKLPDNLLFWCLLFILLSPFTYALTSNVLKQGLAIGSMFLIYAKYNNSKIFPFLLIIPGLFHESAFLFGFVMYISKITNIKFAFYFCSSMVLLSFFGFFKDLSFLNEFFYDHKFFDYINENSVGYKVGFRSDFLLLTLPVLLLAIVLMKRSTKIMNGESIKSFERLVVLYLLFNGVAWFFVGIKFSDRFFLYSWALLPMVSILPMNIKYQNYWRLILLVGYILLNMYFFFK